MNVSVNEKVWYIKKIHTPGFVRRKLGLKPSYELFLSPNEDVMDAFRKHELSDVDIAEVVQKIKAKGIVSDKEIIQIANEIPLYTKKVEAELLHLKANQENFQDLEAPKAKLTAVA